MTPKFYEIDTIFYEIYFKSDPYKYIQIEFMYLYSPLPPSSFLRPRNILEIPLLENVLAVPLLNVQY